MSEEPSSWEARTGRYGEFQPGDHVVIGRGEFSGLAGVVTRSLPGQRYLLAMNGLPTGVFLIVGGRALAHATSS